MIITIDEYRMFLERNNVFGEVETDITFEIDLESTAHSRERKYRHEDPISDYDIKKSIESASDNIISALIKDNINVGDEFWIRNDSNDLNIIASLYPLNPNLNDNRYKIVVVTVMIKRDFRSRSFKIEIN